MNHLQHPYRARVTLCGLHIASATRANREFQVGRFPERSDLPVYGVTGAPQGCNSCARQLASTPRGAR